MLTSCEKEPIHQLGFLQGRGFLIGIEPVHFSITRVSENVNEYLPFEAKNLLGQNIKSIDPYFILEKLTLSSFVKKLSPAALSYFSPVLKLKKDDRKFYLAPSFSGKTLLLELEPVILKSSISDKVSKIIGLILEQKNPDDCMNITIQNIRELIGFSRVMVYRFLKDGSGEVIAETVNKQKNPFLGLRYPQSDIPSQAKALYTLNHLRLINDVSSPVYKIISNANAPLDLTYANLRAVSPTHIQYLKNMGVASSYSISLIDDGKLWGLISCHNPIPRNIDHRIQEATLLISRVMMSGISQKLKDIDKIAERRFNTASFSLQNHLLKESSINEALLNDLESLRGLTDASGLALVSDGQCHLNGSTPSETEILKIIEWYKTSDKAGIYATSEFQKESGEIISSVKNCAGILIAPLQIKNSFIIWFKPEHIYEIQWAGNPNLKKIPSKNISAHTFPSPRKSFKIWRETITHTSEEWSKEEINSVTKIVTTMATFYQREKNLYTKFESDLETIQKDQQFFTYTVSHDLKTPLTVIRSYSQILLMQENKLDERDKEITRKIIRSVDKMDNMLSGIMKLSRIDKHVIKYEKVMVHDLITDIINEHTIAHNYNNTDVIIGDTPPIWGDSYLLEHVFSNIIGNALKYSSKVAKPRVEISGLQKKDYTFYRIFDNGIGIKPEDHSSVYELFNRSENASSFEGSGVGLPIVQTIIEKHHGHIWFISNLNEGTAFYIILKNMEGYAK